MMGLVLVSAANFYPKASLVEQKTFITAAIYIFAKKSLYMALAIFLIKIFLSWQDSQILFNAYSITDPYTNIIKTIIIITVIIILNAASTYIRRHPRHLMEYTVLILLMLLFLQILISSYNLITMFLAIIGFSLNIYVLLLFDSFNHASREAGIKYFYLSTFSSGLIISGIFFAYFLFQNTNFISIA
jgi:NADH:ubiquinone oxidoreductase subunit 2 (subunit N)